MQIKPLSQTDFGVRVGDQIRRVGDESMKVFTVTEILSRSETTTTVRGIVQTHSDVAVIITDGERTTDTSPFSIFPATEPWNDTDALIAQARENTRKRWSPPFITPEICMVLTDSPTAFIIGVWCAKCQEWHEHHFEPAEVDEWREPVVFNGRTYPAVHLAAFVNSHLSNTPICRK